MKTEIKKEVEAELKLWENLEDYVRKNLIGKTLTSPVEKEIDFLIKERKIYLRRL